MSSKETDRPQIKDCFFLDAKGKCRSPEIYRFYDDMDTGKTCPIIPTLTAFFDDGSSYANQLRCKEFRPKVKL
jgi:hypothetical protein